MNPAAGHEAYVKGHIPGARHADLNRDLSSPVTAHSGRHPLPAPDVFAARLGELGVGDDTQVVAYDDANSSMAARLWWMLRWLGHEAVAVLDGGFKAWVAAGGAVESGEAAARPARTAHTARFTPRVDPRAVLSTADLERALQAGTHLLVDARAAERFSPAQSNPSTPSLDTCPAPSTIRSLPISAAMGVSCPPPSSSDAGGNGSPGRIPDSSSPCAAPASPPAIIC
jgi:3-mercaptopyruvate sulfurtransferase SseA